jgi:hypothetical protein
LRQRRRSCRAHRRDPLAATTKNDDLGRFVTIDPIADTHSCARLAGSKSGCPVFLSDPRLQKSEYKKTAQAATPPLSPGTLAPVSTTGPQATSLKTRLRIRFFAAGPMPKRRSERRSAPRPESATPATEEPGRTRHYPRATDTKRLRR